MSTKIYNSNTQNDLLLQNLMDFYQNRDHLHKMMYIINGESKVSLTIVDWFVTNYAKKYYTVYSLPISSMSSSETMRFKVYNDYKLKLKAYSKKRFDPFCRWERIFIPYDNEKHMETTIGQLNFFKWAIENNIVDYIKQHYDEIEADMNARKSSYSRDASGAMDAGEKARKKREELSVSACKCIKKEDISIIVRFGV
jgi:hypothetical protein